MKLYQVVDNGTPVRITISLEELGKMFLEMSKKYPQNDWYWVDELEVE